MEPVYNTLLVPTSSVYTIACDQHKEWSILSNRWARNILYLGNLREFLILHFTIKWSASEEVHKKFSLYESLCYNLPSPLLLD